MDSENKDIFPIKEELCEQSQAMLQYAYSNAIKLPTELTETLDDFGVHANKPDSSSNVEPEAIDENIKILKISQLFYLHQELSSLISPALPSTVTLLAREHEKQHLCYFLGAVPLLRNLSLTTLTFLFAFVVVGLRPEVNTESCPMQDESELKT